MAWLGFAALFLVFVSMALGSHFEGLDENKVEIIRMADKSRQNARKRPLKRCRKYAMIWRGKNARC